MKLNNIKQVDKFLEILNQTTGEVWIEGTDLELYCQNKEDQALFYKFFNENQDAV